MSKSNHFKFNSLNNELQKVKFHSNYDADDNKRYNLIDNQKDESDSSSDQKNSNDEKENDNLSRSSIQDLDTERNDIVNIEKDNKEQKLLEISRSMKRKQSLENIQEKFKNQIERKQKIKDYYNSKTSRLTFRQTIEEESKKNTKTQLFNLESHKNTLNHLPTSKLVSQVASARASFKHIPQNDSVGHSIKSSMVDFFNGNLTEMSEARKRDLELKKIKQQEEDIAKDKSLTEEQRKVKLDNLKHTIIADKVKNIIEKTKKMKESQNKAANKEQKFEMQMRIFKKLDTYLETKDYLQKINSEQNTKTISTDTQKLTSEKIKKSQSKKISSTNVLEDNDDYESQTYKNVQNVLQKSHRYLNLNNNIILQKSQAFNTNLLNQFEQNIFGKKITQDTIDDEHSYNNSKHKFQQIMKSENQSDTNIFFSVLQHQLESGYFFYEDNEKKKVKETKSIEVLEQDGLLKEPVNDQQDQEQGQQGEKKQDVLSKFRKRANQITKLLLNNSKNILKKNIEDTNNTILQARKEKTRQKIQQQLNIKNLEKTIKQLPQKFSQLEKIQIDQLNQDDDIEQQIQYSIEMQKNQDKIDKMEEHIFKQKLLSEIHPDSPSAKKKDIDLQLKNIESSLSSLNSSSVISDDVKKIRNSFERRFSHLNEQKGIITPKQSSFYKMNQEQTPKNSQNNQNFATLLQSEFSKGNTPRQKAKSSSFQIKRENQVSSPRETLFKHGNKESQSMSIRKEFNQEYKEKSPFSRELNKDIFNSNFRYRADTDETIKTKQSYASSDKNKFLAQTQNYKNSTSFLYQTGISNIDGSYNALTQNSKRDITGLLTTRAKTESSGDILKAKEHILDKIAKGSQQNGFSVMSLKQIVNNFREEEKMKEGQNKFIKLSDYNSNNRRQNSYNQPISTLLVPQINKNNESKITSKIILDKINKKNQEKNDNQAELLSCRLSKNVSNNNFDYFSQQKSLNSERQINKNSSTNNIFLTQNSDSSKINYPSERDLISNFLPTLSQKPTISNQNEKMLTNSKSRNSEDYSSNKLINRSNSYNNGILTESNKQLDGIISKMDKFKQKHESDKGYFDKQIAEIEQTLDKQQENIKPQPLESLRLCMGKEEPYTFKNYVYNRKAVQKIL